jgi:hypothetical protein
MLVSEEFGTPYAKKTRRIAQARTRCPPCYPRPVLIARHDALEIDGHAARRFVVCGCQIRHGAIVDA